MAVKTDPALLELTAAADQVYIELLTRQRSGVMVPPRDVNAFYKLRQQVTDHPVTVQRDQCLRAVKALCIQVGAAFSKFL